MCYLLLWRPWLTVRGRLVGILGLGTGRLCERGVGGREGGRESEREGGRGKERER